MDAHTKIDPPCLTGFSSSSKTYTMGHSLQIGGRSCIPTIQQPTHLGIGHRGFMTIGWPHERLCVSLAKCSWDSQGQAPIQCLYTTNTSCNTASQRSVYSLTPNCSRAPCVSRRSPPSRLSSFALFTTIHQTEYMKFFCAYR